jgi:hypothetical protein
MSLQRNIYRALAFVNDGKAIARAARTRSPRPVIRRAGRRAYGKLTGRIARRLFG